MTDSWCSCTLHRTSAATSAAWLGTNRRISGRRGALSSTSPQYAAVFIIENVICPKTATVVVELPRSILYVES